MGLAYEDLEVLKKSEVFCDEIWAIATSWTAFEKETIGKQMARSADSIGANIAEGFGRFHWGEKIQFFYYARGSIFETKYWLNRSIYRELISEEKGQMLVNQLEQIGKNLNNLIRSTKKQKTQKTNGRKTLKDESFSYLFGDDNVSDN